MSLLKEIHNWVVVQCWVKLGNSRENGCLEVQSFETLKSTFKIKWLIDYLKEKDKNIVLLKQVMMADGLLLTYKELSSTFDLTINIEEYPEVFNGLPRNI